MNPDAENRCTWTNVVFRSLTTVVPNEELASIADHLSKCTDCAALAERGGNENIALGLRSLTESRKAMPTDLSVPVSKLNAVLTDYRIIDEIGRGGMGVVYKAWQIELERLVALKVLPGIHGALRPDSVSRFRREAALAAQLKHSNIVSVYDCGQVDGTLYYAMELIEGKSVADLIQELRAWKKQGNEQSRTTQSAYQHGDTMSDPGTDWISNLIEQALAAGSTRQKPLLTKSYFRYVAERIAEVADALFNAHSHGVIHRDVKPSNLLVASDGRFMIADFGLAVRPDPSESTFRADVVGTYRYMSPEMVDRTRGDIDHRADIYALGATIYELLTLRPMLVAEGDHDLLLDILHREPTAPRIGSPNVPRELEIICLKAVAKDPLVRYQTAKELADDLNRWLLDLPIVAKRPFLVSRIVKFARRHRVGVVAASLVLASISATVAYSSAAYRDKADAEQRAKDVGEQRVERAVFDALSDVQSGRPAESIRKAIAAVDAFPQRIIPHLTKAIVLSQCGYQSEATQEARMLAEQFPGSIAGSRLLVRLLESNESAEDDLQSGGATLNSETGLDATQLFQLALVSRDRRTKLKLLDSALEREPDHVPSICLRCLTLMELGENERMLRDADRIIQHRPEWSFGFGQRGLALDALGQWQDARRAFDRAIAFDPNQVQWLVGRSHVKLIFGDRNGALDDASHAVRIDLDSDPARLARAAARLADRDFNGAIEDYNRLIEGNPKNGWYYYRRSQAFRAHGRFDKELEDLRIACRLEPTQAAIFSRSGKSLLGMENYDEAILSFTRALEIQPDVPQLRYQRAVAFELAGEYRQALSDYESLSLEPTPLRDHAIIARYLIFRELNDSDHAEAVLNSIEATSDSWMGCVRDFVSHETSREQFLKSATSRPQRCEAFYYIARISLLASDETSAISALRDCIALNPGGVLEAEFADLFIKQLLNRHDGDSTRDQRSDSDVVP